MDDLIRAGGFRLSHVETHYIDGPKLMTFMYQLELLAPRPVLLMDEPFPTRATP